MKSSLHVKWKVKSGALHFLGSLQWPVQNALHVHKDSLHTSHSTLFTAVTVWVACFLHSYYCFLHFFPSCFISGWRWPILGMPSTLLNFPRCGSWHAHFCSHSGCWNPALWVPCVLVWARCWDHLWGSSGCMHGEAVLHLFDFQSFITDKISHT